MSNGLIWEGLGRALSQAGGTIGGYMAQDAKDQEAERLLALREEAAEKRQMALLDAKEAKEEATAKRNGLIAAEAEVSGKKAAEDRSFEKFARGVGPDTALSPEALRATYDEFYGGGKEPAYAVKYSEERNAVLNEIRKSGGNSKMIESAQNDVKMAQKDDRTAAEQARKDLREERRYENEREDNKRAQAQLADQGRRTDALIARVGAGGGGKDASTVQSVHTNDKGEKVAVMRDGSTKPLGIKSDTYERTISNIILKMEKDDFRFKKLPESEKRQRAEERLVGAADDSAAPEKPASTVSQKGGQSTSGSTIKALPPGAVKVGTSGGKTVYEVNGKRYIQQ